LALARRLRLAVIYGLIVLIFGSQEQNKGVVGQTGVSFVRQDLRLAVQKLVARLEEGIEVLSPEPGHTARELVFKDVLNNRVRLSRDERSGALRSWTIDRSGNATPELAVTLPLPGKDPFLVTQPIEVPDCESVVFTGLSQALVTVGLTLKDGANKATLLTQVRLRNGELVP
jgi:hypothetical protein